MEKGRAKNLLTLSFEITHPLKTEAVKKPSLNSRAGERARLGEAVAETWFVF